MIDMACREYAEARKILGSVSLRDAARYFVRHNLEDLVQREVPEIVEEMIEARRNAGVGTRGMRDSIRKGMTEPLGKSSNKPGW